MHKMTCAKWQNGKMAKTKEKAIIVLNNKAKQHNECEQMRIYFKHLFVSSNRFLTRSRSTPEVLSADATTTERHFREP